jgi:signal transduction histidine kinase
MGFAQRGRMQKQTAAEGDLELTAELCHELSQPLCHLLSSLGATRRRLEHARAAQGVLPERDIAKWVDGAYACADHMARLLAAICQGGRREPSIDAPVDLVQVIEAVVAMAATGTTQGASLSCEARVRPRVKGSETQLRQVILNLLTNAIQALPKGEAPPHRITIVVKQEAPREVVVEIEDTGPGIAAGRLRQVTQPHGTTRRSMGLGLAIAKRIVEAHGGRLALEPLPERGTRARVVLPSLDVAI